MRCVLCGLTAALVAGLVLSGPGVFAEEAKATRGYLGVSVAATSKDAAQKGAVIKDVQEDSPAGKAGLKNGDVIVGLGKVEVKSPEGLLEEMARHKTGEKVQVRVLRDGKEQKLDVTLTERKEAKLAQPDFEQFFGPDNKFFGPERFFGRLPSQPSKPMLGVMPSELTPDLKKQLELTLDKGVVIQEVIPNSTAAKMGLQAFDVITELNNKVVNTPDELREAVQQIKPDQEVTVKVVRGKETKEFKAKLQATPQGFGMLKEWGKEFPLDREMFEEMQRKLDEMRKHFEKFEPKKD